MHKVTGAQAVAASIAVVALAITVPLFGIFLIPIVALTAVGRVLATAAATVATLVRPALSRWPGVAARGSTARSASPAA